MVFGLFSRKPKHLPLEDQLSILAECGIRTRSGITIDDFFTSWSREEYESDPFTVVLTRLGGEVETEPLGRRISDDIWHLDTECVEDDGAYVCITEGMSDLAKGDLPITNIRDHVDIEAECIWLEFDLDGQTLHWDPVFRHDWVDEGILSKFAALLVERRTERRFTYLDLGGQDCLLGCSTPSQLAALRKRTPYKIDWLA